MSTKKKAQPAVQQEPIDMKQSSEDGDKIGKNPSTSSSEVVKITLEEYLRRKAINPGLIASFKVEASKVPGALEPKAAEEWEKAFHEQSIRHY